MLTTSIRFKVSLESIKHIFGRKRNLIIHHGLMGSSKNFRSLSKAPSFSKYVNSYLIDARNHGTPQVNQEAAPILPLIPSKTWLMICINTL